MRWLEYAVFLGTVFGLARPVDLYVARVFEGKPTPLDPLLLTRQKNWSGNPKSCLVSGGAFIVTGGGAILCSEWSGMVGSKESSDGHRITGWTS
jgi:hypothetical protein